jgi:L-ribulose-5-phosphate 3-epimerase
MTDLSRRNFIQTAALTGAGMTLLPELGDAAPGKPTLGDPLQDMPVGIISNANNPEVELAYVKKLGFKVCQLGIDGYSSPLASRVKQALRQNGLQPTSLICGGPGPEVYDFYQGPATIGLVPRKYRKERIARFKQGIDFCREAGIPAVQGHFGFIPENPGDPLYSEFIAVVKEVAGYAKERGIVVGFETGQETPVTLLRAIEDTGTGNLFVNYDVANLILYGKANPLDGLEVIGKHVRSLHAKDGFHPTNPRELGKEAPVGKGKVNFPGIIRKLKELKFKGHIIIEYELGPQAAGYLAQTKQYLEQLIRTT